MKDIKTFLIGFLTCACLFLIMGQTKNTSTGKVLVDGEETTEWIVNGKVIVEASDNGRYQAYYSNSSQHWLLDTVTGAIYNSQPHHSQKKGSLWELRSQESIFSKQP